MEKDSKKPYINVDYFESLTGDIPDSGEQSIKEIGERIKVLRNQKGISLDELSQLTGFDVSFLSDIESNKIQPQLGTIIKLSKALDSAFGRLVSEEGTGFYSITRKDERKSISRSTGKKGKKQLYAYKSLAPDVKGRHMEALLVELEENAEEELSVHEGEEFIYVLKGTAKLIIGEKSFDLEPGDSVYYLSTTPHMIAAREDKAVILAVLYEG